MASVYEDKKKIQQPQARTADTTATPKAQSGGGGGMPPQQNNTGTLQGVSAGTQQQLQGYQNGYNPSQAVQQAQQALQQIQGQRPGSYQSNYTQQLQNLYDQITNRNPFKYDLNGDMLYQQYKDQYQQAGRQAMMDTMGQAATMTGGYGNSYASTAGNQAYQQYLTQLNNLVPDLYDRAAARYDAQGQNLMNQYSMAMNADQADYGRWQDQMSQWNNDLAVALDAYNNAYNQDYSQYNAMLNYWTQMAQAENQQWWNQFTHDSAQAQQVQQQAYQTAMMMLQSGKMPTTALLTQAGISTADAQAMLKTPGRSGGSPDNGKPNSSSTDSFLDIIQQMSVPGIAAGFNPPSSLLSAQQLKEFLANVGK